MKRGLTGLLSRVGWPLVPSRNSSEMPDSRSDKRLDSRLENEFVVSPRVTVGGLLAVAVLNTGLARMGFMDGVASSVVSAAVLCRVMTDAGFDLEEGAG